MLPVFLIMRTNSNILSFLIEKTVQWLRQRGGVHLCQRLTADRVFPQNPLTGEHYRAIDVKPDKHLGSLLWLVRIGSGTNAVHQGAEVDPRHIPDKRIVSARIGEQIGEVLPLFIVIIHRVGKRLPPVLWRTVLLNQQLLHVPGIIPGDEVILVLELPVERRDGIAAVLRNILHRDLAAILVLR